MAFAKAYPEKIVTLNEARDLVTALAFAQDAPPAGSRDRVWERILQDSAIAPTPVVPIHPDAPAAIPIFRKTWFKVVAGAAAVVVAGLLAWPLISPSEKAPETVATNFGEHRQVTLPDQSVVMLNGNSSIKFNKAWGKNKAREVWIDGEAFLKVQHLASGAKADSEGERFLVHLKNLEVEVLGTSFNVRLRKDGEEVMLQEGSVQVKPAGSNEILMMQPGDAIRFDEQSGAIVRKKMTPGLMNSWTNNQLHFEATPIPDVVKMLEDTYGLKVTIANPTLLSRTISGDITAPNETVLLKALELMLQVQVTQQGKEVTIR
jgi:ferric-dicitrate binding protein FerR (iron transport regulator)